MDIAERQTQRMAEFRNKCERIASYLSTGMHVSGLNRNQQRTVRAQSLIHIWNSETKELLYTGGRRGIMRRVIMDTEEIQDILRQQHSNSPIGVHSGINSTLSKVTALYYWPSMKEDIRAYVESCDCQRGSKAKKTQDMERIDIKMEEFLELDGPDLNGSPNETKWNNVKDNKRKSLDRINSQSEHCGKKAKNQSSKQLSPFNDKKKTKSNIDREKHEKDDCEDNVGDGEREAVLVKDVGLHKDLESQQLPHKLIIKFPGKSVAHRSCTENVTAQETSSLENQTLTSSELHPVDAFLAGIAPTLKSLNAYHLHLAKSEIFATVQKYEMKMLRHTKEDLD